MRLKIATALLLAGTVVGCASNPPPPPPPMAEAPPPPAPPPPPPAPMTGTYRGMADLAADAPASCHKMNAPQTARVRGGAITVAGMRGTIGPDGSVTPTGRGANLSGTVSGGTADLMIMRGRCSYHYTLNHA